MRTQTKDRKKLSPRPAFSGRQDWHSPISPATPEGGPSRLPRELAKGYLFALSRCCFFRLRFSSARWRSYSSAEGQKISMSRPYWVGAIR